MNLDALSNLPVVTTTPLANTTQALEKQWLELEEKSNCSVFLTWGWIGNWLTIVADELEIFVLRAELDREIVGLGLLVAERIKRRGLIKSNTMVLNSIKHSPNNMIIEHNRLLLKTGLEEAVSRAVLHFLESNFSDTEEFIIPYSDQNCDIKAVCRDFSFSCMSADIVESPFIDLDFIRRNKKTYMDCLSKNTRHQLRKSLKAYQAMGELGVEEAGDQKVALAFFEKLKELHQHSWQQRGRSGSFNNQLWEKFHRNIINNQFASQQVQLLRIFVGNHDIGIIYSLVHKGRVNMLQTGFDYDFVKNAKPGYVCHYLAVEHNLTKGLCVYDFLAGDSQYKRSLANTMAYQEDLILQRKKLKFFFENALVYLYRKFR